jgi:hypothetical protein
LGFLRVLPWEQNPWHPLGSTPEPTWRREEDKNLCSCRESNPEFSEPRQESQWKAAEMIPYPPTGSLNRSHGCAVSQTKRDALLIQDTAAVSGGRLSLQEGSASNPSPKFQPTPNNVYPTSPSTRFVESLYQTSFQKIVQKEPPPRTRCITEGGLMAVQRRKIS